MAQHDYDIANQSGANFRADLNNALDAIVSNNSGSSAPSTTFAYEWWIDTSNNLLKLRNSANNAWITLPLSITADNSTSGALTVNGNLTTTGSVDVNGQELILDADADTSITADTDDQIDFKIGGTDVATLTNSHLVLKGTTPKITIGDGGEEDTALIFDGNAQDFYIGLDDSADDLLIGTGSTVGSNAKVVIENGGSVAIGSTTADPLSLAFSGTGLALNHDSGTAFMQIDGGNGARIDFGISGSRNTTIYADNNVFELGRTSNHPIAFKTNNTERMRIDASGRLLVNISTNPSVGGVSSGHFTEALSATNWIQAFRNSQSTPFGISIKYTATPNDTGKAFLYCEDGAPAARFEVMSNGGLKNYAGNDVNLSDEREKKNIVNADNQLENIKNLLIKSFHYNEDDDSAEKRLGVIAQEVETNLPHLVEQYSNIGGEERKGVKEQQLMWMAIKAIQELEARVQALEE